MASAANPTRTPSGILTFIGGVLVLAIFAALVVFWVSSTGPKFSVEQRRAELRKETAEKLHKETAEKLAGKGWVDRQKGIAHIPLPEALQLAAVDLKNKKVGPSEMKLVPPLPMPVVDPNSTEPARPALPSAPQGADTVRFAVPGQRPEPVAPVEPPTPAPAPAPKPAPVASTPAAGGGEPSPELLAEGKKQYVMICGACHQPTGAGLPPVFPPLINTEYVKGDPKRLVAIMLKGVAGPITVDGKPYNNVMPGQGAMLNDKTIAAIGTYVRKEFGGGASPITPELSAEVRKEHAARVESWTEAELKAFGQSAPAPAEQPAPAPTEQPAPAPAEQPAPAPAEQPAPAPAEQPAPAPAEQPAPAPVEQPAPAPVEQPAPAPAEQPAPAPVEQPQAPASAETTEPAPNNDPQASVAMQVRPFLINWTESK